jgi:hypothetical protein
MFLKYLAIGVASVIASSAGSDVRAQIPARGWDPPQEIRPVLTIRAGQMSGSIELQKNEYVGLVLLPGFRDSESLCATSLQVGFNRGDMERAAAAWHVEGRLVDLRPGEATLDVRWTRRVNRHDLVPADSVAVEQRVVFRAGVNRILDLVRSTRRPVPECDSFGLTYEVEFEGPRELGDAAIAYDLWLVQEDADGELVTERYQVRARQAEQVDYFFKPVPFTADGRRSAAAPAAVLMNVSGAISGRVRTDGKIDLMVDGTRAFSNAASSAAVSSSGRTLVTTQPGETIEIEANLPLARGLPSLGDLNQIFGEHRTAVRITAKRLW